MKKNENGFTGIEILIMLVVVGILAAGGLLVYNNRHNQQKNSQILSTNGQQKVTVVSRDVPPETTKPSTKPPEGGPIQKDPSVNSKQLDYPKPTPPSNLKILPSGSGYKLTWDASVATSTTVRYQVFYQGNMIAEPTTTTYLHNLPPPPPGCKPISLTYYIKAVDSDGKVSDPSNSATVEFGGC